MCILKQLCALASLTPSSNSRLTLTKPPSICFSFFVYFLLPVTRSMLYFLTFLSSPITVRVAKICLCSSRMLPLPLVSISISRVTCFIIVFGDDLTIFDCHSGMFMMASRWMLLETSAMRPHNEIRIKLKPI